MKLHKQKKLASRALASSPKRIKFNAQTAEQLKNIKELISREGVKELLAESVIIKTPPRSNSRTRANRIAEQKKKGRRQGHGSRKGTAKARFDTKDKWIIKIRALRAHLKKLKDEGRISTATHRELYRKCKGNFFRNKRHLMLYITQNHMKQEAEKNDKEQ